MKILLIIRKLINFRVLSFLILFVIFVFFFFSQKFVVLNDNKKKIYSLDIEQIRERGYLTIGINNNSLHYYVLQGEPYGFHFEIIRRFSKSLGVDLKVKIISSIENQSKSLLLEETDIACLDYPVNKEILNKNLIASTPITVSKFAIVEKRNHNKEKKFSLSDKLLFIPQNSIFSVYSMFFEIVFNISTVGIPEYGSEQLIDGVADNKIPSTLATVSHASMKKKLRTPIEKAFTIDYEIPTYWLMRRSSKQLVSAFNSWFVKYRTSNEYASLYNKYIVNQPVSDKLSNSFFSGNKGKLSGYDKIIKEESKKIGWDWRLLSALIYEESHFQHDLVSSAGAYGIMQFMPETAKRFGVDENSSAEQHIAAGARYIKFLNDIYIDKVQDENQRIKFVIASYNIGAGHILDAMELAAKYGKDKSIWDDNTEYYLILKKQPAYYNDLVVKNGYLNGKTTANFVKTVLSRYEHFKNNYPE